MCVFLFTDIEGSTRLWADYADEMSAVLAIHDRLVLESVMTAGGTVSSTRATASAPLSSQPPAECALLSLHSGPSRRRSGAWSAASGFVWRSTSVRPRLVVTTGSGLH